VQNNPIRYSDPTGHKICEDEDGGCKGWMNVPTTPARARSILHRFGVKLSGKWDDKHIYALTYAVVDVGTKFASARGIGETSSQAFNEVYDGINFSWGGSGATGQCADPNIGSGGCTSNSHQINFWSMSGEFNNDISRMIKNVVHELGHAYDNSLYDPTTRSRASTNIPDIFVRNRFLILRPNPVCDTCYGWQQNREQSPHETFGDMFIAWTYGVWNTSSDPNVAQMIVDAQAWMNGLVP